MRTDTQGNFIHNTPVIQIPREPLLHKPFIGQESRDFKRVKPSLWRRAWAAMFGRGAK